MKNLVKRSIQDIFSLDVLLFVLKISILSGLSAGLLLWYFWEGLSSFVVSYLSWIPWEWLQDSGASVITFSLAYMLFIIMVAIFTSLLSEALLIKLAKKHYPILPAIGEVSIAKSLLLTLKASAIFLLLFMFALPFIFIPIIGQVILLYLWSILLREPTIYDVGALFITDKSKLKKEGKRQEY